MTMTGVDEGILAGRMTGAMGLRGEDADEDRRAAAGAMDDGQRVCIFSRRNNVRIGVAHLWTLTGSVTTSTRIRPGGWTRKG